MTYNSAYVLDGVVGMDITQTVSSYFRHPIEETRLIRTNALYDVLDVIYKKYLQKSLDRVRYLKNNISYCRDYDTVLDMREEIADIMYTTETITDIQLMAFYPKIKL